jgi:pyruvate formate lyase activating enzyme
MNIQRKTLLEEHTIAADPALVRKEEGGMLQCFACAHTCRIPEGASGRCKMRANRNGELRVPGGYVAGIQVDPIEKKPFYHVYPGREALSFGMLGCDLHCPFCQNWHSSQVLRDDSAIAAPQPCSEAQIVDLATRSHAPVMVSTYNEPLITADWAVRIFRLAQKEGIECGFVSNGNASPEVLEFLRPHMGLYKIDLKSFQEEAYKKLGGSLKAVLDTIERAKALGFWVEVVTLVVPGFNDAETELRAMAKFIAGVSPEIPWHVTAYHPSYKMQDPPSTSVQQLERACLAGKNAGLQFIYAGNMPGGVGPWENTHCPACEALLIERRGFHVLQNRMKVGACPDCSNPIPGVWEAEPPRESYGLGLPRAVRL